MSLLESWCSSCSNFLSCSMASCLDRVMLDCRPSSEGRERLSVSFYDSTWNLRRVLSTYLFPRAWSATASMLDEQMTGSNLVWLVGSSPGRIGRVQVLSTRKRADRLFRMTFGDFPC